MGFNFRIGITHRFSLGAELSARASGPKRRGLGALSDVLARDFPARKARRAGWRICRAGDFFLPCVRNSARGFWRRDLQTERVFYAAQPSSTFGKITKNLDPASARLRSLAQTAGEKDEAEQSKAEERGEGSAKGREGQRGFATVRAG